MTKTTSRRMETTRRLASSCMSRMKIPTHIHRNAVFFFFFSFGYATCMLSCDATTISSTELPVLTW